MNQLTDKKEITSIGDIRKLVDSFYKTAMEDNLLAPVFAAKIRTWDEHLDIMYRFWQTVLLEEHTYNGAPFMKHIDLPVDAAHFERWTSLFNGTVDSLFTGEKATEAKWRAARMAEMFMHKLDFIRKQKAASPSADS